MNAPSSFVKGFNQNSFSSKFLDSLVTIVNQHLTDPEFGVPQLANQLNLSVSQINRKLSEISAPSAGQLIRNYRLKLSLDLLRTEDFNVSEIAYTIGFSNPSNFCRSFKQYYGCTPSEYVKSNLKYF